MMAKNQVEMVGQCRGKVVVLERTSVVYSPNGSQRAKILLQCVCGSEPYETDWGNFKKKGEDYSCSECRPRLSELDLTGQKSKHLTAISRAEGTNNIGSRLWSCLCDCGNTVVRSAAYFVHGKNPSCGCFRTENMKGNVTHGFSNTPEHKTWCKLKERCNNPNSKDYHLYGGRGIKVCNRWVGSFENFLEDMGKKPEGKFSIDRLDVNGNYEPSNCRWATDFEQAQNKRFQKTIEVEKLVLFTKMVEVRNIGFLRLSSTVRVKRNGLNTSLMPYFKGCSGSKSCTVSVNYKENL